MHNTPKNTIEFRVWGRYAMFTDPLTRIGGEKCSYHIPTYEALKGIAKSIYWKPTFLWFIDSVRIMKRIRTQTKGMKPLDYNNPGNTLAIYTYLTGDAGEDNTAGVEYQVRAHFEWNLHQPDLARDRVDGKHFDIARRSLERGGRQDIFLGTRDCQGYVEPCEFGSGVGEYDNYGEIGYGLMFHSFGYPDETGSSKLMANFWRPTMIDGMIRFPRPEDCPHNKPVREMTAKQFGADANVRSVESEGATFEVSSGGDR